AEADLLRVAHAFLDRRKRKTSIEVGRVHRVARLPQLVGKGMKALSLTERVMKEQHLRHSALARSLSPALRETPAPSPLQPTSPRLLLPWPARAKENFRLRRAWSSAPGWRASTRRPARLQMGSKLRPS